VGACSHVPARQGPGAFTVPSQRCTSLHHILISPFTGTTPIHKQLDEELAAFLGKPAALTFGMGFATNSVGIPLIVGRGSLIISDALNHASIVAGARGSGAKVKVCNVTPAAACISGPRRLPTCKRRKMSFTPKGTSHRSSSILQGLLASSHLLA
jgi:Aminotransferase class I and II